MSAESGASEPERIARGTAEARLARAVGRPRSGWWLLGLFALQLVAAGGVGAAIGVGSDRQAFTTPALGVAGLAAYAVLLAGTIVFARRSGSATVVLALRRPRLIDVAIVPVVLVAVLIAAALINSLFHGGEAQGLDVESHPRDGRQWIWLVVSIAVLTVVAPVCEELFFRGAVFSCLASAFVGSLPYTSLSLIAVSGVVFGAAHLIPAAFPALAAVGMGLGYLRLRSGSVVPGMVLHIVFNSIAVAAALSAGS